MKIFLDIGHPAHVHYFKNFIRFMKNKGHEFFITARDKEVTHKLLDYYKIPYKSRGLGQKRVLGKLFYLMGTDYKLYLLARKFNPDLFLSFASPYAAQVSKLFKKPHVAFDDTEHARYSHRMYVPFTNTVLTPIGFKKRYGDKQIFFDGTMDLCYLNKKYFKADINIKNLLGFSKNEEFIFLRFVSWNAMHDIGQKGISNKNKVRFVKNLSNKYNIFISSEGSLPAEIENYRIKISPEKIHDVLSFAKLYVGESTTMATESATLGTPAICINSGANHFGVFKEFKKYNLIDVCDDSNDEIFKKINYIMNYPDYKKDLISSLNDYLKGKIDVTSFMVWFIENYPESFKIMKENSDYQYKFI